MLTLDITGYTAQEALTLILFGLQAREATLQTKINAIKAQLTGEVPTNKEPPPVTVKVPQKAAKSAPKPAKTAPAKGTKRAPMSEEARERIIAAQKKRWAKVRRAKKAAATASAAPQKATPHAKLNLAPPEEVEAIVEELVGAAAE